MVFNLFSFFVSPLYVAVKEKHVNCVDSLLHALIKDRKEDEMQRVKNVLAEKDEKEYTPLKLAIAKKNVEIVNILLTYEKMVDYPTLSGEYEKQDVLDICGMFGNIEIFDSLIQTFPNKTIGRKEPSQSDLDQVFISSVKENNDTLTKDLINIGADINKRDKENHHALKIAVENDYLEIVHEVLENELSDWDWKAIFFRKKMQGLNLLHLTRNFKITEKLIHFAKSIDEKQKKMKLKHRENIKSVGDMPKVFDQNVFRLLKGKDKDGNCPLHLICENSNWNKVEFGNLLKFYKNEGISLENLQNNIGQTPLHIATRKGNMEYIEIMRNCKKESKLFKNQAVKEDSMKKVDQTKKEENDKDDKESEKRFRELVKVTDLENNTALHIAAEYKHFEILKILLSCCINHKPANRIGRTPLHVAAEFGDKDCLESIINHVNLRNQRLGIRKKINLDGKDLQGKTPLQLAVENGRNMAVEYLMKAGADVSIHDNDGRNALELAIEKNNKTVIEIIIESENWEKAMRASHSEKANFQGVFMLGTPMRSLIKSFPNLATKVLDKCCKEETLISKNKQIKTFNFEFLEDTFKYKWDKKNKCYVHIEEMEKNENDDCFPNPYIYGDKFVSNHPLMMINDYKQQNILNHKVTRKLINCKWKDFGFRYYALNFLFYAVFLTLFSIFIYTNKEKDPSNYPNLFQCSDFFKSHQPSLNVSYIFPSEIYEKNLGWLNKLSQYSLVIFSIIRFASIFLGHEMKTIWKVIGNIWFLITRSFDYLMNCSSSKERKGADKKPISWMTTLKNLFPQNVFWSILKKEWALFFDVIVYIMALFLALSYSLKHDFDYLKSDELGHVKVYLSTCILWQLSAGSITLAWINLVIYMRQFSLIGKYIIILNDIIYTFLTFMLVFLIFVSCFCFKIVEILSSMVFNLFSFFVSASVRSS